MAASMVKCRICSPKALYNVSRRTKDTYTSYWTAIPQMPKDTEKTNALLRYTDYPAFSKVTVEKILTGSAKTTLTYDVELTKHIKKLNDAINDNKKPSFSEVYNRFEELSIPVEYMKDTCIALSLFGGPTGAQVHAMLEKVNERLANAKEAFNNRDFFDLAQKLDPKDMKDDERRVLEKINFYGKTAGFFFNQEKDSRTFQELCRRINEEQFNFNESVAVSFRHYMPRIENPEVVQSLPPWMQKEVSINKMDPSRGPWMVPLDDLRHQTFLMYCPDRLVRKEAWARKQEICSLSYFQEQLSNYQRIEKLLELRGMLASHFGEHTYVAHVLKDNRMISSTESLIELLSSLKSAFKDACHEEIEELQQFATSVGFQDKLQWWDLEYYQRLHFEHHYKINSDDVIEYFPYDQVQDKMFALFSKLLGLSIKDCTRDVEVWDRNVRFFKVYDTDKNEDLGAFYLDPFYREGRHKGYSVYNGRERSAIVGVKPFVYMFFHVQPPVGNLPALLTVRDLDGLFQSFARCLQMLLSQERHSQLSGFCFVDSDVNMAVPHLFSQIGRNPHIMRWLSSHYRTGEQLSEDVIDVVLKGTKHMSATHMMRNLFTSALDVEMHLGPDEWYEQYDKTFNEYMPLARDKGDWRVCSMTSLFGQPSQPVMQYSRQWNEVVAADLYNVFEEVGFENLDELVPVGKRLKETFLYSGSLLPQRQVFRRFVGRDPATAFFLQQNNGRLTQDAAPQAATEQGEKSTVNA